MTVVLVSITLAVLVVVVMFWGLSVCEGFARVYFAGCDTTNTYAWALKFPGCGKCLQPEPQPLQVYQKMASYSPRSCYSKQEWPRGGNRKKYMLLKNGHPTTVFCKLSVRGSKYCLGEFSITWGGLIISRWPFHSGTILEAYQINPLRFSEL